MPTDAEITTFICMRVLRWEPWGEGKWYCFNPGKGHRSVRPTPDFLAWAGFGLLWEALMKGKKEVVVNGNEFGAIARVGPYTNPGVDPDPKRALMLAAARACGMEGV